MNITANKLLRDFRKWGLSFTHQKMGIFDDERLSGFATAHPPNTEHRTDKWKWTEIVCQVIE